MSSSNTLEIIVKARDEASKTLDAVSKKIGLTPKQMKYVGGAMLGAGTAMAMGLVSAANAAAEEETGIVKLSTAMKNMGLSYDDTRESLEAWIDAQQQKTSVADSEQRDALATLITATGDMTKAQDLLSVAMDVSAGTGKDLASSTQLIGYALAGNWGMVERMIPSLKEVESEEEKWALLRQTFAGQAEAYGQTMAGQMETLKNNMGDVKETLGAALLPVMTDLVGWVQKLVQWVKGLNPDLIKWVAIGTAVAAAMLSVGGGLLLIIGFLPQLAAGLAIARTAFGLLSVAMSANPIGLIILAVAALIAIIILVVKHWDKIKEAGGVAVDFLKEKWEGLVTWFKELPEKIKGVFEKVADFMTAPIRSYLNVCIDAWNWLAGQLNKVNISIPSWLPGIGGKSFGFNVPTISRTFAEGGVIDEPTLMYGMRSGRYSLAGEAGPEVISPAGQGVTVNIYNPSVRSDSDLRSMVEQVRAELTAAITYRTRSARGAI
jgi:uncharacterized membrane protein YphA (DoxX/SURF4 family)